jgi:plasmid stabilization system protein ParE
MSAHNAAAREAHARNLLEQLEELARSCGLRVRSERGDFRSGRCRAGDEEMIILNRRLGDGDRALVLARLLGDQDLERLHLRPDLRRFIDQACGRTESSWTNAPPVAGGGEKGGS